MVTLPWPCGDTPVITRTEPVGRNSIVAESHPPAMYLRAASTRDGAMPHISSQVENPTPMTLVLPLARRSACCLRMSAYPRFSTSFSVVPV